MPVALTLRREKKDNDDDDDDDADAYDDMGAYIKNNSSPGVCCILCTSLKITIHTLNCVTSSKKLTLSGPYLCSTRSIQ